MNAAFRHLAVRIWVTVFVGGLACLFFLPWWQRVMGITYLNFPAALLLAGGFIGAGWVMNRIGMGFLNRHVDEAAGWERAGMVSEAEAAFDKAKATFDSFWLSPILRRCKYQWFSGVVARFYLGMQPSGNRGRGFIPIYLKKFPYDEEVAEPWLEQLLTYETHMPQEHEAVGCISESLPEHQRLQRLLMQFYLANGRTDFAAIQTYRRVWRRQQPLSTEIVQALSRLLHCEYLLSHWALEVYLKAYESGDQGAIEGIVAAAQWLKPVTEHGKAALLQAESIIAVYNGPEIGQLNENFNPNQQQSVDEKRDLYSKRFPLKFKWPHLSWNTEIGRTGKRLMKRIARPISSRSMHLRRVLPAGVLGVVLLATAVLGWRAFNRAGKESLPAVLPAKEVKVEITDPFTIQVAAYLKSEDAQRFVNQLIEKKLDAFWTQEKSANRTWYQVKVSHFAHREAAQKYGQELKAKGLIDDFYVANYDHQRRKNPKVRQ